MAGYEVFQLLEGGLFRPLAQVDFRQGELGQAEVPGVKGLGL
jgi:predicted DNA-binding antitoxin AbrB/MazE fold protein